MRFVLGVCFILGMLGLVCIGTVQAWAQESDSPPAQIELTMDRLTLDQGQSSQAVLILRNTSSYTLTNIKAEFQGATFTISRTQDLSDLLQPYTSTQAVYTLQSQTAGSQAVIFAVQYSWNNTGINHQWLETALVEGIEVIPSFTFNWPDFLIPLVAGFAISQLGIWLNDRYSRQREEADRQEQARGVLLAILYAARKGVNDREDVSFMLWEEVIVKGNLYPAIHAFSRKIHQPDLSRRLTELSIGCADYNKRLQTGNLTDERINSLSTELAELIKLVEQNRQVGKRSAA